MTFIIPKQHINKQVRKFEYNQVENGVYQLINDYHDAFVKHFTSKRDLHSKYQKGGRVAFPLEYFGGNTTSYTSSPSYTNISSTEAFVRPPILLNDPSGSLATPKAMEPLVGGRGTCFQLTKSACKNALEKSNVHFHALNKQKLAEDMQQKFERIMTKALHLTKKRYKTSNLKESDLASVLNLQSYKNFKA